MAAATVSAPTTTPRAPVHEISTSATTISVASADSWLARPATPSATRLAFSNVRESTTMSRAPARRTAAAASAATDPAPTMQT
jgi:hypothetical protein